VVEKLEIKIDLLRFSGKDHFEHSQESSKITGWWFGTFFIFHNIWDNPSH
jgi:hypothetical protein